MLRRGLVLRSIAARRPSPAYVLLTVAYAVSGALALLLAVPPGFASPIFPPAGIAVTAMLIGGPTSLPWTFLGSFLLNLWVAHSIGLGSNAIGLAAAFIIAMASTLQAAAGGAVLRRAVGHPAPLDNSGDLSRFLLLSPAFCLTSATLSLGGLAALGQVRWLDLPTNWFSWWTGDTLGVLLVLPLMLIIAGEPRGLWRSRALPVGLPMLLFFVLFVAIFARVSKWEQDEALVEFRLRSQEVVDKVRSGFAEQAIFLEQLERSFSRPAAVSRSDFRHLTQSLLQRFSTIQAVKWAPRTTSAQRIPFEAAQQAEVPGFEIREADPAGHRRRAAERTFYYPVSYVEPMKGNELIVGFDLASEPGRKTAIEEAFDTGSVSTTPPIRLLQEQREQAGILIIFPVNDGPNGAGVLAVALRMGTFMTELLVPVALTVAVRLVDAERETPLYSGFSAAPGRPLYNDTFAFGGRFYRIETVPTPLYLDQHRRWQSWAVLAVGVVSTGLLGALLLLRTGHTRRIETIVEERTSELEISNRRLQFEIRERQQAEAALRQAQRMEAIGQLTGGIAHDFNNLLTVIAGNATLLRDKAPDDAAVRRAAAIMRAAEQGERLTRQLLTFSRRQTLRPDSVDLRQRTQEIGEMLSRSLREDIAVSIDMAEVLWPVAIDLAEFELALLNIAVNARDAMPQGGQFRVEAKNLSLLSRDSASDGLNGDFVAVTLSDTGTGMPADVSAHAFEPFFTTKEVGLGSGLGLSQVYGFAKQSGGTAVIRSEIGKGTAITLFLQRATGHTFAPSAIARDNTPAAPPARILLVEDDVEVSQVTTELLKEIGSDVVWARDGKAALAAIEQDPTIEFVISDIVMPGEISGLDLARTLRERRPVLPVLLATGYSRSASLAVNEGFTLVEKPYRRDALAAVIRAAVERTRRRPEPIIPVPPSESR